MQHAQDYAWGVDLQSWLQICMLRAMQWLRVQILTSDLHAAASV